MNIGVVVPLEADPDSGTVVRYAEARDFAVQAEAAGFDAVWVYDHLLFRAPDRPTAGMWEAWTVLAALSEATSRVALGTLVLCTPFRNPALLAKMAATLDEISAGRLILGLGAGWHRPEFDAFGFPFDHRVDRFEEALRIIVPLLREGRVSVRGRYYQAEDCELVPRSPRPQGPPLLVAATGPRMLRLAARYADLWNTAWLGPVDGLAEPRAELEAACEAEGRDPAALGVTVGVTVDYTGSGDGGRALTGTAEEIAAALRGYAEAGVAHVICAPEPGDAASLTRLAQALTIYRDTVSAAR